MTRQWEREREWLRKRNVFFFVARLLVLLWLQPKNVFVDDSHCILACRVHIMRVWAIKNKVFCKKDHQSYSHLETSAFVCKQNSFVYGLVVFNSFDISMKKWEFLLNSFALYEMVFASNNETAKASNRQNYKQTHNER